MPGGTCLLVDRIDVCLSSSSTRVKNTRTGGCHFEQNLSVFTSFFFFLISKVRAIKIRLNLRNSTTCST